jgi:hypothetical protein
MKSWMKIRVATGLPRKRPNRILAGELDAQRETKESFLHLAVYDVRASAGAIGQSLPPLG